MHRITNIIIIVFRSTNDYSRFRAIKTPKSIKIKKNRVIKKNIKYFLTNLPFWIWFLKKKMVEFN